MKDNVNSMTSDRNTEKIVIGYTTGVYDLFHIGHLNLLKNAKGMCDYLVVGVTVDDLVGYKGKQALIPFEDRIEIVRSCKYVDAAVPQYDMDKLAACKKLGATVLFVGDDWYGTEKWKKYEEEYCYVVYAHIAPDGKRYIGYSKATGRRWRRGEGLPEE